MGRRSIVEVPVRRRAGLLDAAREERAHKQADKVCIWVTDWGIWGGELGLCQEAQRRHLHARP